MNITLVGFMGTGKSAVGRKLSASLGMRFVDIDDLIEEDQKTSINEIFDKKGEGYFRAVEKRIISDVSRQDNLVISAGGGAVIDEENVKNLKTNGPIICLEATADVILKRTKHYKHRPLLNVADPKKEIGQLLKQREPFYARADFHIDTSHISVDEVMEEIQKLIKS